MTPSPPGGTWPEIFRSNCQNRRHLSDSWLPSGWTDAAECSSHYRSGWYVDIPPPPHKSASGGGRNLINSLPLPPPSSQHPDRKERKLRDWWMYGSATNRRPPRFISSTQQQESAIFFYLKNKKKTKFKFRAPFFEKFAPLSFKSSAASICIIWLFKWFDSVAVRNLSTWRTKWLNYFFFK